MGIFSSFRQPGENLAKLQAHGHSSGIKMNFDHITTTLGIRFQEALFWRSIPVLPAVSLSVRRR